MSDYMCLCVFAEHETITIQMSTSKSPTQPRIIYWAHTANSNECGKCARAQHERNEILKTNIHRYLGSPWVVIDIFFNFCTALIGAKSMQRYVHAVCTDVCWSLFHMEDTFRMALSVVACPTSRAYHMETIRIRH